MFKMKYVWNIMIGIMIVMVIIHQYTNIKMNLKYLNIQSCETVNKDFPTKK